MIEIEKARQYYTAFDAAHDFDHVLRVLALAERIGQAEGADMEIVRAAVLLHDVARAEEERTGLCHAQAGAERARQILAGHPANKVEAVAQAIASHRFRDELSPQTLEAKVLYDADKLDAIGAIGIARAYALAGKRGRRLWAKSPTTSASESGSSDQTPVHEFVFKLSRLKDSLFTNAARQIAEDRHRYMVDFFARLEAEVRGEY
ncbi:MAG TPA: HD domain-containing protein [Anaerolineae bacterium]|nr:HD domain-containing protein [Anaerolineae bacterium]